MSKTKKKTKKKRRNTSNEIQTISSDGKQSMLSEKLLGVYVETDFESKRITIGKGRRKIIPNTMQAKVLSKTLNRQIQLLSDIR